MKKSTGGLQSTVKSSVGPGQSLDGGPRGEAPGSSAYSSPNIERALFVKSALVC